MKDNKKYFLAIDLGSTSFKAAVFDERMRQTGGGNHRLSYLARDTRVEFAIEETENAFQEIICGAISSSGINAGEIKAIGIASQAQTFTVSDRRGHCQFPFISWEDRRSRREYEILCREKCFSDFKNHSSFFELQPNHQICQLKRLVMAGMILSDSFVVPLPSHLIRLLTGKLVTDNNLAAMSGLYSLHAGNWHHEYLNSCGITAAQLPEIVSVGSTAGNTTAAAERFGLLGGIPVCSCGNDQTAGGYGAQLSEQMILATLGSAQVLYQYAAELPAPQQAVIRGIYPKKGYYRMLAGNFGGNLIGRIVNAGAGIADYDDFFRHADQAEDDVPDSTVKINEIDGTVLLQQSASAGDIAFAALRYLCREMKSMYDRISDGENAPDKILVAGGGSKNRIWVKILEREFGRKLQIVPADALLGTARMIS